MNNLLLLIFGCLLCCLHCPAAERLDPRLQAALTVLDSHFDSCFAWWGQVYDPASGGCYYSLSGKAMRAEGDRRFAPDLEATSKLVDVLEWHDLLGQVPQAFNEGIISYMQSRQDAESGFFRDPEFADRYSQQTLNRAVGMASGALERCGGAPLHPLPVERISDNQEAAEHYAHLRSAPAFKAWLDAQPWGSRIWTCGANILTQSAGLAAADPELRSRLLDLLQAYLVDRQAADGYLGRPEDDTWFSRLSGTYKAMSALEKHGREIPGRVRLTATVLKDLRERDYTDLIVLYNTCNLLTALHRNGGGFLIELRVEIIERATAIFARFKHEDGGVLTDTTRPRPEANGKLLGRKGVMESNTNSTGLAHKSRNLLYELATGNDGPVPHPQGHVLVEAITAVLNP